MTLNIKPTDDGFDLASSDAGLDFHITIDRQDVTLDVFKSKLRHPDAAHILSCGFGSVDDAIREAYNYCVDEIEMANKAGV